MLNAPFHDSTFGMCGGLSGESEYEDVWAQGFKTLQFPPSLENRYLQDKAAERLRLMRLGAVFLIILTNTMLAADWFMVPDRFQQALALRVLIQTPLAMAGSLYLERVAPAIREELAFVMGLMTAGITCYLAVTSQDPLAPDYLVSLFLVLLFNGGVIRMRFWLAVRSTMAIWFIFLVGVFLVPNPPVPILMSAALVMVSSAVFALLSSYRSEHEERSNWLLSQHQKLLNDEVAESSRQLDRLSRFDPLTDLANRRYFDEFLRQVWSRAQRNGEEVALLMIDIDHFKHYNDHHGHVQGDICIQNVARALKSCVRRPEDLIARYGGEEFVAVLPDTDVTVAMAVANRIRQGVADLKMAHEASPGLKRVSLSIGVACMRANEPQANPDRLIACADAALYQAKAKGRDTACAFDQQDQLDSSTQSKVHSTVVTPLTAVSPRDALQDEIDQALIQIDQIRSPLRFPARLEHQFQRDCVADRLHYFAICGLAAFLVFNGFLLTDYLLVNDVLELAIKVRLGIFSPIALALLYVVWFDRDWFVSRSPKLAEATVVFSGVAAAASMGYILSASQSPMSQLYHAGLAVVIIYGNMVQRLRFWFAALFSAIVLAIHAIGMLDLPAYNPRLTPPLLALMMTTIIFSLMANHALERDERKRYLLTLNQKFTLKTLEAVRSHLQTLSRVDALTGLFNRRHFHEYLQQVWQRAQHKGDDVAIIILDVDHFKKFNDHYGHQAGDVCLAKVAQAMKAALRQPGDVAARLGGEEFIAVLPQTKLALAEAVAERIRQAVQALAMPHDASSAAAVVTVSVGAASWPVRAGQSDSALIAAADEALYQAKRDGRNRVVASI